MNEPENDSSEGPVDLPELLARVENDRELLRDLLTIFRGEFPRHVRALREAVISEESQRVALVAHTLKGMLLNVAATRGAAAAARLEQLGRDRKPSGFQEAFVSFESETLLLLPHLETCMAEVCR
jgi:HPt (histidine-containing phosphotransfer) domain-containing protein